MADESPSFAAVLRHLVESERRSLTDHPTPQELVSYHEGELPPEAESRLREHLTVCRDCSDLLLDLAGFGDLKPGEGVPELTDDEVEQDWQALRSRMGEGEEEKTALVVPLRPSAVPGPERRNAPWLPVAASLLAVLGFSFGLYQELRYQELRVLLPKMIETFDPQYITRGSEDGSQRKMSSQEGGVVTLYLDLYETYPVYRVEIVGETDTEVLWSNPVKPGESEHVSLLIPGGFLDPGPYRVRLYGIDGGRRATLTDFSFDVDGR